MRFDRLDLNLLHALDVLIEECNVSAAARRLHLSQSATSGARQRLREYFRDELLVSSGSGMVLTFRGHQLRKPVRDALLFIRANITAAPAFDPKTSMHVFKIMTSDYVLDVLLGPLIRVFELEAPNITIETTLPSHPMLDLLNRGDIDLILTLTSALDERHPKIELFTDDHVLVSWAQNTRIKGEVTADLFQSLDHVVVNFGSARSPAHAEAFYQAQRINRNIVATVPFFSALPSLLVGTQRVATMVRRQATLYAGHLPLSLHTIPYAVPDLNEGLQYITGRSSDAALQWLVSRIVEAVRDKDFRLTSDVS